MRDIWTEVSLQTRRHVWVTRCRACGRIERFEQDDIAAAAGVGLTIPTILDFVACPCERPRPAPDRDGVSVGGFE